MAAVFTHEIEFHVVQVPWQTAVVFGGVVLLAAGATAGILIWVLMRNKKTRSAP